MTQEVVNKMINDMKESREANIEIIKNIVNEVLDEYDKLHNGKSTALLSIDEEIENGFTEDEKNSINIIRGISSQPNWTDFHDTVWRVILELKHSITFRRITKFSDTDLTSLARSIDIDMNSVREEYEKRYLDSSVLSYDGDLVICDPTVLFNESEEEQCQSLYRRNTLDNNTPFYMIVGNDNSLLGSITTPTVNICTVLAKDIWSIPSAGDALKRMDVTDYTFIKQFHGTVQFFVESANGKYILHIEGKGNKPFRLKRVTV